MSRSHDVSYVELVDGRRFVVKQVSAAAREQGRSLGSESFVYRLAGWIPEVALALPRPLLVDERHQVLALEAAPACQLYVAHLAAPNFPGAPAAAALGATLARVHRATTAVPTLFRASVGVLDLPDVAHDHVMPAGGETTIKVVDRAAADSVLMEALRSGRRSWRARCLIHGDVKWDNTILDPGPPVAVKLFDWELAGSGDPAWDLGSALADLRAVRIRRRGSGAVSRRVEGWMGAAELALLRGYAGSADELDDDFAERVLLYWIGRTVHLSLEASVGVGSSTHPAVTGLLHAAQQLAALQRDLVPLTLAALDRHR